MVEQDYGYAAFDGSFDPIQIRTVSTAIKVPIKDSPSRYAAFRIGFSVGWRLAVTMTTATVIAARRAWSGTRTA
jgi:hypothetical protein